MKTNKIPIHVKSNVNSFLNTLFGAIMESKQPLSPHEVKEGLIENAYAFEQVKQSLLEIECKKSQAIMFIHRLQNH